MTAVAGGWDHASPGRARPDVLPADRPATGTVLAAVGGTYSIELPTGEQVEAVLRGRLKRN